MTQTNPEQWAVEVREVETVTGDFGTEPGTPFYRIEIGGYCADFDYREGAQNFADAIQAAFAEQNARLVGALAKGGFMMTETHNIGEHRARKLVIGFQNGSDADLAMEAVAIAIKAYRDAT